MPSGPSSLQALHESGLLHSFLQSTTRGKYTEDDTLGLYVSQIILSLVRHYSGCEKDLRKIGAVATGPLMGIFRSSKTPNALRCAAECIYELSADLEVCNDLVQQGLPQCFGGIIHPSRVGLQDIAVKMLGRLVDMDCTTGNAVMLLEGGAVQGLLDLVSAESEQEDVVYGALAVLLYILKHDVKKTVLPSEWHVLGLCGVIARGSVRCRLAAAELVLLTCNDDNVLSNCIHQTAGLVSSLADVVEVAPAALELLALISQDGNVLESLSHQVTSNSLRKLAGIVGQEDQKHAELAVQVLVRLTGTERGCRTLVKSGVIPLLVPHFSALSQKGGLVRSVLANLFQTELADAMAVALDTGLVQECDKFLGLCVPRDTSFDSLTEDHQDQVRDVISGIVVKLVSNSKGATSFSHSSIFVPLVSMLQSHHPKDRSQVCACLTCLLTPRCQSRTSRAIIAARGLPTLTSMLTSNVPSDRESGISVLRAMTFDQPNQQVLQSSLISQICLFLKGCPSCMCVDGLSVLCGLSRCYLQEVCSEITRLGAEDAVWAASTMLPPAGPLNKVA